MPGASGWSIPHSLRSRPQDQVAVGLEAGDLWIFAQFPLTRELGESTLSVSTLRDSRCVASLRRFNGYNLAAAHRPPDCPRRTVLDVTNTAPDGLPASRNARYRSSPGTHTAFQSCSYDLKHSHYEPLAAGANSLKVRCDKRPGVCCNCERLGLECTSSAGGSSQNDGERAEDTVSLKRLLRGARACSTCRIKKIKCSGTLPTCVKCRDNGLACAYPPLKRYMRSHDDPGGVDPGERRSPRQHHHPGDELDKDEASELLLSPSIANSPQKRGLRRSSTSAVSVATVPTTSPSNSAGSWDRQPPFTDGQAKVPGLQRGPSQDQLTALVHVFFDIIYPMPSYAFLHPQTTQRRCRARGTHHALTFALCAVAALYLRMDGNLDPGRRAIQVDVSAEETASWINTAEQDVWMSLESPSISRLQALLLVIHYHMETGRFQRAFMLTATAARFASAMRLNHERHDLQPVAQEARRRILWSLKITERYFSAGLAEFDMLPLEVIYIKFPSSEKDFLAGPAAGDDACAERGAYGLIVQLEAVRRDVMKLTRSISLLETPLSNLMDLINHHCQAIANVGKPPPFLEYYVAGDATDGNPGSRWLPRLVLANISWHQAHCDLYRILLPGYSEAAPAAVLDGHDQEALAAAERSCLHHAMRIIYTLTALNQHSIRHHLLEFDTAICAYHATRLVLFISRFGKGSDRPSPEFAVSRAELCLAALKRFFLSSALVNPIIRELEQSIAVFTQQQKQGHQAQDYRHARSLPVASSTLDTAEAAGTMSITDSRQPLDDQGEDLDRGNEQAETRKRRTSDNHFSTAAHLRQRLAVHSLLRRANFPDDGNEEDGDGEQVNDKEPVESAIGNSTNAAHGTSPMLSRQEKGDKTVDITPAPVFSPPVTANAALPATSALDDGAAYDGDFYSPSTSSVIQSQDFAFSVGPGTTEQGLFAWWGPQDWGWLFTAEENSL
ncbi:hypothetical protein S7711_06246 [Stachybotrys chartarum IBT 7711]|uniref:Zn(2)-C6 fungal-type domain-containing protein n=1 Tax=Stachybotrys chartarum (strain CBS 109288 / IBT 7711) TaxID=1280523 RepID=A0A084B4Y1_STACB|nr:hypothetical protein S7711_06246 [Stachybotrys chartarum IBT 7711]